MKVKVYATLRPIIGGADVPTAIQPGRPVRDLVDEMVARWPDLRAELLDGDGNLQRRIQIMVNGRNIKFLDGLDTALSAGDSVAIFPPVGGG